MTLLESGHDEKALADLVFEKAGAYLQADVGFSYRFDAQTDELVLVASTGIPGPESKAFQRLKPGQDYCGQVAATRQALVADASQIAGEDQALLARMLGLQVYACFPLQTQGGQLIGTFTLASRRRSSFNEEEQHLLQALSHILALVWERIRTEQELRRGEQHLCVALDAGGLGTWWRVLPTEMFHMDARARAHFGFEAEAVTCETLLGRVHQDDVARLRQELAEAAAAPPGEPNRSIEYRVIHPDGSVHWLEVQGKAYQESPDPSLPVSMRIGTSADITERKCIEHRLFQTTENMKRAQAMTQVGSWRIEDLQRHTFECSDEAYRLFELPPGTPLDYGLFISFVHPEDRERVTAAWGAALAGSGHYDIEYRILARGRVKWIRAKAELEFDSQGQLLSSFGTLQDITDRKLAELALRESQQRYEALFANQTTAIAHHHILCDEQGRPIDYVIDKVNQTFERLSGWRKEEIEGRRVTEVFTGIRQLGLDVIGEFGRIALESGEGSFELYCPATLRWVSVYAYSPKRGEAIAIISDVTAQKHAEAALRDREASLRATFEQAAVGIVHVDPNGRFLRVNRKFSEMLGYSVEELCNMGFLEVTHEQDRAKGQEEFRRMAAGEIPDFTLEKRYRRRDGSILWVRITASAVFEPGTHVFKYNVSIVEDITAYREAEQRARDAALHDPLTRLPNRRLVFEYAEHLLAAAARHHAQGAFLFIDLDRFKPINDVYGHEAGDRLLEEVARRLVACVRQEDLVGRLGGDEFVIVLQHLDAPHHAVTVAHHVIEQISRPVQIRELNVSVSPSIGISFFPQHGLDVDTLLHAADLAMYQSKQSGAGNYEIYHPDLARRADQMSAVETRLKQALRHDALTLHYQPVIDMKSRRPSGAEALLRFAEGDGPAIGPAQFIPVAEAAGLIGSIGEWVALEACRQHATWLAQGLPPIPIAINVSPLEFRQRDFAERLISIVRGSGIDPACLQIEVTESTVMDSVSDAIEILQALKSAGIKVALDDFGTGYSSLSRLSQLPLDKLKVDQSFVGRVVDDAGSRAITEAVIALGRSLNLEVVGEGIESDRAFAYLNEHGCNLGQGYFFSRPLPQQEFASWYRSHWESR